MTYQIAQGVQVSIDGSNWYALTDHNRQPINITYNLVEQADRMADGTMRKYVIARKFIHKIDWKDVPTLDSYLVDYVTNVSNSSTTTTTNVSIPSSEIVSGTFIAYDGYGSGSLQIPILNANSLPRVGQKVTISGLSNALGSLQNGVYQVTQSGSGLITIDAFNVSGIFNGVSGNISWVNGIPITTFLPGTQFPGGNSSQTWVATGLNTLSGIVSVGDTISIFGSTNNLYNGTFAIQAIVGNTFLISGIATASIISLSQNAYMVEGTISTGETTTTTTTNSFQGPYGPAWIKAFYEGNYSNPVYVRFIFAQQEPMSNSLPVSGSYTSSLQQSIGTNPATGNPWNVYQAFMTTFTYNITKRMKGNAMTGGIGYDHVDISIEFTEV
jgi:hypothetical protein